MKTIRESIVSFDSVIREKLKSNTVSPDFYAQTRNSELSKLFQEFMSEHSVEFNEWLNEIKALEKMSKLENLLSVKIKKDRFNLTQDPTSGRINLKRGVLSLGSFPKKDIHTLVAPFGIKEREPGYYLLVLYMMEDSRSNILNYVDILKSY